MSLHASLLAALLPEAELRSSFSDSDATDGTLLIFDPYDFLRHEEPGLPGEPLARHWGVTSDSIAARLASVCEADELVLLKSALPPTHGDFSTLDLSLAAARGYFDGCFAQAARELPRIRCINFRDDGFSEAVLADDAD